MEVKSIVEIRSLDEFDYNNKTVILRVDINSPIDPETKRIVNFNRIKMSIPTIKYLIDHNAKLAIIAHQGDTLDYQNLIPLREHADKLSDLLGTQVKYVDDVAGPEAQKTVIGLKPGQAVILGNLRYLCEEISTFENAVKLKPEEMLNTYLIRSLAPLADYYVNDAFAAAHRNAPSMVAFQELLPTAGGKLLMKETEILKKVMENPDKPSIFVLGGAKISDAFGMMETVLKNGTADKILATGVVGEVMLLAKGISMGQKKFEFLKDRSLDVFIEPAKEYLDRYSDKIVIPLDLAYEAENKRYEVAVEDLPIEEMFMDIGARTVDEYRKIIDNAGTIFVNGPAGVYESDIFENGTKELFKCIADSKGYSVIGGGDTVSAAAKFIDINDINYVCTAGGAMVNFLSGKKLPLIEAMRKAYKR